MKTLILALLMAAPAASFADGLDVQTKPAHFDITHVVAHKVKGVYIRLSETITRNDCNQRTINSQLVFVSGNKKGGWYQTDIFEASTISTLMGCPLKESITETIYSKPIAVDSFTNENLDGEVDLTLIVPSDYKAEVTEIK